MLACFLICMLEAQKDSEKVKVQFRNYTLVVVITEKMPTHNTVDHTVAICALGIPGFLRADAQHGAIITFRWILAISLL